MKEVSTIVILFGGSGDLAHRKLYPALYSLYQQGLIKNHFAVIGTARRPWSHEYFQNQVVKAVKEANGNVEEKEVKEFASHFYYQSHDVIDVEHYIALKELASELDKKYQAQGNRIFYMAMAPHFFETIASHIKDQQLLGSGFNRLVIEKPFGHDLATAEKLNQAISASFPEDTVYRIDHYLGKEMVQNIMPFRFSNSLIEKIWNKNSINNIQVTLAESLGVGTRGGYYDGAGALRDMVQNHIFQIITLLAMGRPSDLTSEAIHQKKQELLASLVIPTPAEIKKSFVRGQYLAGSNHPDYRHEDQVDENSMTETFVAGKVQFAAGPVAQIPIYFRTGKDMKEKLSRIDIVLNKEQPLYGEAKEDVISIIIDPVAAISMMINGKKITGSALRLENINYEFSSKEMDEVPDGYVRLLRDVFLADRTNFTHWQELKQYWRFVDAVEETWQTENESGVEMDFYHPGEMGPKKADDIFESSDQHWIFN
ncbi:glucose-6-phosphate dehydrogenase [Lactobacillus sp. PV012]|uniref:glucose-6-phosphate dehydrogenase n=1 Tax=Lactobacillus sp. PV012 TaxID=2594494 RepID=UPI00223FA666|nr:glucose-6-phosphate dehydrogenase [Lactobacillus sp. PV012]QNQ81906.1 glucose-6-phosphate dehydrogenase [Lactobacillus sp. PV012]